jgi:hypothetical protein
MVLFIGITKVKVIVMAYYYFDFRSQSSCQPSVSCNIAELVEIPLRY